LGVEGAAGKEKNSTRARERRLSTYHLQLATPVKSAYELAMERLEKEAPTQKLTEQQKAEIAEIESTTRAKVAEKEVFLQGEIAKMQAEGKFGEVLELEQQLAREIRRINEDGEAKKAKVRQQST
jgi:hypothetical protein